MKENKISKERREYLKGVRRKKTIISILQVLILLSFLIIWEVAARMGIIDSFITSQPSRIINTFLNLSSNNLIKHIGVTFYETIVGFLIGSFLGYVIAIILWWSDYLSKIFEPYLVVLNSLPKVALRTNNYNLGGCRDTSNYCDGDCYIVSSYNFRKLKWFLENR